MSITFKVFVFSVLVFSMVEAQEINKKNAYYLDINNGNKMTPHSLISETLNIQYNDRFGKEKTVLLKVLNWESEEVGSFQLSKSYGLNHFKVNLGNIFSAWKEGDVYRCQLKDETGYKYELLLKKTVPLMKELGVSIFVNPLNLDCDAFTGNLVDFYASIDGGKAPYTINWFILDKSRTNFLYQPRSQEIDRPGRSTVVRVDKNPDYYVMALVTDACGVEQKEMVYLACQDKKKKVNTVFVEPLQKLPVPTQGIK